MKATEAKRHDSHSRCMTSNHFIITNKLIVHHMTGHHFGFGSGSEWWCDKGLHGIYKTEWRQESSTGRFGFVMLARCTDTQGVEDSCGFWSEVSLIVQGSCRDADNLGLMFEEWVRSDI